MDETEVPKQRRYQKRGKITAYPKLEADELYRVGKINGWDTAKLVTDAIERALFEKRETLLKPADQNT
jgi:hypothetical protein